MVKVWNLKMGLRVDLAFPNMVICLVCIDELFIRQWFKQFKVHFD